MANTSTRLDRANFMVFDDVDDQNTSSLAFTPMMALPTTGAGSVIVTNQPENGFRTIGAILADNKYDLIFEATVYNFNQNIAHLEIDFGYDVTIPSP